jgi:hypothetical protein
LLNMSKVLEIFKSTGGDDEKWYLNFHILIFHHIIIIHT